MNLTKELRVLDLGMLTVLLSAKVNHCLLRRVTATFYILFQQTETEIQSKDCLFILMVE